MKRIATSVEARESEAIVAYLERKLTKERERLDTLHERDARNLVHTTLMSGSHPGGMLLLRGGERAKYLRHQVGDHATIRSGRVCYSVNSEGMPLILHSIVEKQGHLVISLADVHIAYLMEELSNRGADVVPGENVARVILFTKLTNEQKDRYWVGTYRTLVSRKLITIPEEEGDDVGCYDQYCNYINGPHEKGEVVASKREWRSLYAERSPVDGLWYCKRTMQMERDLIQ